MDPDFGNYVTLSKRYAFGPVVIARLAKVGVLPGGRIGGKGPWLIPTDTVLHTVERRQRPLAGTALADALEDPYTTKTLAKKLRRSEYTVREMLKDGVIRGWNIYVPNHLKKAAGKKVCERWYVDKASLKSYLNSAMEDSLRLHLGRNASDEESQASEGSI